MDIHAVARANVQALRQNPYPGRGIVIGLTPDARHFVQVYWIMGRSENSRNRVFVEDGDVVRTAPFDASKVKDPSLIIYNCTRSAERWHVVSNGDQTDTIAHAMLSGDTFGAALCTRTFEPDAPNYTPRIAGIVNLDDGYHAYKLAILKTVGGDAAHCARHFYNFETPIPGIGHCVTTYKGDGNPLPPFEGEPYAVELLDDLDGIANLYWGALNAENRVSLLVKMIDAKSAAARQKIVNKHG